MEPRRSFAASGTTYHSFHDIELQEPPSPPRSRIIDAETTTPRRDGPDAPAAVKMQRQDSGYESHVSRSARNSTSLHTRPAPPSRRTSNASSAAGPTTATTPTCRALRARPSTRRSAKSYPQPTAQSLYARSTGTGTSAAPAVYFQFPTPDLVELTETPARRQTSPAAAHSPPPPPPPPTTHYWTSDSTRRLEYAAIDAASRGFKGWIRRHLVPDCFTPRHVAFDDDSGSVRRYRLELEDDHDEKHQHPHPHQPEKNQRRRGWSLFSLRKSNTI
ncbi:hypothetical protein C2857_005530 [Epichloe festucae Fl1]|uniref:Uncharacterized protein n=1 Tax=Epichloe festucae (strain Fl1) TaxID=877507 RepID=A0A7S9PSD2_EPIFF|nr:hypothetical protein C2857_005530 [Epichloe festucae Fl1]